MITRMALALALVLALGGPGSARGAGGHGGGGHGGGFGGGRGGSFHGGGPGGWRGGGWHGGGFHRGFHGGSSVFFGVGPFFYDPFWYPAYPYYGYGYGYYPPPAAYPPYDGDYPDTYAEAPPPDVGSSRPQSGATAEANEPPASYGLVQLRGIPDGASIDLDGRFWLTARNLDDRWLALPQGEHVVGAQVDDASPVERRVVVAVGKTQVVRFSFPRARG